MKILFRQQIQPPRETGGVSPGAYFDLVIPEVIKVDPEPAVSIIDASLGYQFGLGPILCIHLEEPEMIIRDRFLRDSLNDSA
ncbi:MAG: hypothetical protein ACYTG7_11865 [Planctomycetota bacterium]